MSKPLTFWVIASANNKFLFSEPTKAKALEALANAEEYFADKPYRIMRAQEVVRKVRRAKG